MHQVSLNPTSIFLIANGLGSIEAYQANSHFEVKSFQYFLQHSQLQIKFLDNPTVMVFLLAIFSKP